MLLYHVGVVVVVVAVAVVAVVVDEKALFVRMPLQWLAVSDIG